MRTERSNSIDPLSSGTEVAPVRSGPEKFSSDSIAHTVHDRPAQSPATAGQNIYECTAANAWAQHRIS
jgi:hypothetical protein